MSFRFLYLFLFLAVGSKASPCFELNNQVIQAYQQLNRLDFVAFDSIVVQLQTNQPLNRFGDYLESLRTEIILLIDENPIHYRQALSHREQLIQKIENTPENSPYKYWALADIHMYWALIRAKYNDELHAALDLRQAIKYGSLCKSRYPWFLPVLKTNAICLGMATAVPDKYSWLAQLAGIKGNKSESIQTLEDFLNHPLINSSFAYLIPEAACFYIAMKFNIYGEFENQVPAIETNSSELLQFAFIWLHSKTKKPEELIKKVNVLEPKIRGVDFCYLKYLKAEAKLNLLIDPQADFLGFLLCTKGHSFKRSAFRKLAWNQLIQGNEKGYREWMKVIQLSPTSTNDEDIQAGLESQRSIIPPRELIQSRLLFDGGNFQKSLDYVQTCSPANLDQVLEKDYRIARCLENLNQRGSAVTYYKKVIKAGSSSVEYFAASSALQLALYYQNQNKTDSVNYFCSLVETLPNLAYKKSLSMKARALKKNSIKR
jgi:tetratricopeptide (TPR) repeat protein